MILITATLLFAMSGVAQQTQTQPVQHELLALGVATTCGNYVNQEVREIDREKGMSATFLVYHYFVEKDGKRMVNKEVKDKGLVLVKVVEKLLVPTVEATDEGRTLLRFNPKDFKEAQPCLPDPK